MSSGFRDISEANWTAGRESTGPNENKGQNTSTTRVSFITVMSFSRFSHGIQAESNLNNKIGTVIN